MVLPGLLTEAAIAQLIGSLDHISEIGSTHNAAQTAKHEAAEAAGTLEDFQKEMQARRSYGPGAVAAEHDTFLEACIVSTQSPPPNHRVHQPDKLNCLSFQGHPQMLALARAVLGPSIRYDHMVALIKNGGHQGQRWHTHHYASAATVGSSGNDEEGLAAVAADPVSPDDVTTRRNPTTI